jgi:hypothetical protein
LPPGCVESNQEPLAEYTWELLVKLLPGDKRGERELIKLARLHFDIWEIVFAEA